MCSNIYNYSIIKSVIKAWGVKNCGHLLEADNKAWVKFCRYLEKIPWVNVIILIFYFPFVLHLPCPIL